MAVPLLRRATHADSDRLLEWRNDPQTRAASRNTSAVQVAEHERWVERVLADPERMLLVAESEGDPVGQVRLDPIGPGRFEISIALAPQARGRGLGRATIAAALDALRAEAPGAEVEAHVRTGNSASREAFVACGFVPERSGEEGFEVLVSRPLR